MGSEQKKFSFGNLPAAASLWLVCLFGFLPLARRIGPLLYFDSDGVFRISDFAYYYTICRAFWTGENTRLYEVATHIPVLSHAAGTGVSGAMPLAILPTALLVWAPFLALPPALLIWSYSAWVATSSAILLSAIGQTAAAVRSAARNSIRLAPIALIFFFSSTFVTTVILGQTSILGLGLLGGLVLRLSGPGRRGLGRGGPGRELADDCCVLFLLSLKIQYLFAAVVLLLGFRRFRSVAAGILIIAATVAALSLRLGMEWVFDYSRSLALFFSGSPPPWIAPSFVPENMILFSTSFAPIVGRPAALSVAAVLYLAVLCVAAKILLGDIRSESPTLPQAVLPFAYVVSGYLLFTPYMGHYEDLLLFAPLISAAAAAPRRLLQPAAAAILAAALFFVLNHGLFRLTVPLWPFWFAKLLFLGTLIRILHQGELPGRALAANPQQG